MGVVAVATCVAVPGATAARAPFAAAAGAGATRVAARSALEPLPAGWAPGGKATDPQSQVRADTVCGTNSVLLFSARGSGDVYGGDLAHNKIGAWTQGAGIALTHAGWNVRDLQAIYPAPPVPLKQIALAIAKGGLSAKSLAVATLIVKQYRDAASTSWKSVRSELEAAYQRCPSRKILLAGYSQGGILLRYVVPRLPPQILKKIVSLDLIADPTEQRSVDAKLTHPPNLDGRLTNEGIDTFSGLVLNAGSFRQTSYPTIAGNVYQYCMDDDLVCNFRIQNLSPDVVFNEGKIHASYGFELIGIAAGRRFGASPTASGTQLWTASYQPGSQQTNGASAVTLSPNGETVYVTGSGSSGPSLDYVTVAYSSADGARLWVARYDGPGYGYPIALAVSPDGARIFVTGRTNANLIDECLDNNRLQRQDRRETVECDLRGRD